MPEPIYPNYESVIKEENINDGGSIQLEWNDTVGTPIEAGTPCPIDSDYVLLVKYYPSQTSVENYHYNVTFPHKMAQMDYLPFYFKTRAVGGYDENGELESGEIDLSTYPYTGNIQTIAEALADCLTEHEELGIWTADTQGLSGSIIASINFDGATIKSAASAIAEAFDVDYWFEWSSHTIKFGVFDASNETPPSVSVVTDENGVTAGVEALVSTSGGDVQYNVFRILGGTKNMSKKTIEGKNMQVTQRLMLDANDSIIDTRPLGSTLPKIMKDLVFDDIYPKMELWIYDVHERQCWLTDENGKKIVDREEYNSQTGETDTIYKTYSKWYFKLARWNGQELVPYIFDPSLIIEGKTLSMVFQPNYEEDALPQPLIGREFELSYYEAAYPANENGADDVNPNGYTPTHGEFRIIFKVEGDMILPSTGEEGLRPYGGAMSLLNNKVTLTNVAIDSTYIQAAKTELQTAAEEAVEMYGREKSSITYVTYGTPPTLGGNISKIRHNLITGEVQYTVGDYKTSKSLIGRLSDKVEAASSGGGSSTISEANSDKGSGISEISVPLLSCLLGSGNIVKDTLTILNKLIFGLEENGQGVVIDGHGDASMTIGSLTVLGATHLNEIDVNHIRHTGGMMVVTKANIIVDSYEVLDGGAWKLYYRRRDGNGQAIQSLFQVNDFALMMTFNEDFSGSVINRFFWRQVVAVGIKMEPATYDEDGHVVSEVETDLGYIVVNYGTYSVMSNGLPPVKEGDVVVQLGNSSVRERQGATVLGGSGPNGGFIAIYDGFNVIGESAPNLDNYNTALVYLSPKQNKITGNFLNESGGDLQSQITALTGSLTSIQQQSDRQLVIWYGDNDAPLPNSGDLDHWNTPAKDWHDADVAANNTDQQSLHLEDVFYLRRDNVNRLGGRAWQWTYDQSLDKFLWVEISDVDTIAALEAADDAVATAKEAAAVVNRLADDGVITAGAEKSDLLIAWQDTVAEYLKLIEQAEDYSMNDSQSTYKSTYDGYKTAYRNLAIMLNGFSDTNINSIVAGSMVPSWLNSLNRDTELEYYTTGQGIMGIDGTRKTTKAEIIEEYRSRWEAYFNARAALLKAIEAAAKAETDRAHGRITDLASDGIISGGTEKSELLIEWKKTVAEYAKYILQAEDYTEPVGTQDRYVVDTTAFTAAYTKLATMLNGGTAATSAILDGSAMPSWLTDLNTDTTISQTTLDNVALTSTKYREVWNNYHIELTDLLEVITNRAKELADAAQADATLALSLIDGIAADGVLSTTEIPDLKREFETAYRKRAEMADLATDDTSKMLVDTDLFSTLNNYLAAFKTLANYLDKKGDGSGGSYGAWDEPTGGTYSVTNATAATAIYNIVAKSPLVGTDFPALLRITENEDFKANWASSTQGDGGARFRDLWADLEKKQVALANMMATINNVKAVEAHSRLDDIASDGIISAGTEKNILYHDWQEAVADYQKYTAQAANYFGSDNSQDNALVLAFSNLATMLNDGHEPTANIFNGTARPAWITELNMGVDTVLSQTSTSTAANYHSVWNAFHTALAALLETITQEAKRLANAAQTTATNAMNAIGDMADDTKLDPSEKLTVKREFVAAYHEMMDDGTNNTPTGILKMAKDSNGNWIITYSAWISPYITAFRNIGTYLNGGQAWTEPTLANFTDANLPSWIKDAHMSVTQNGIVGSTWRDLWATFYARRTAVLTALSDKAQTTANTAQTTANSALSKLADISNDGVLDPTEKIVVKREFLSAWRERASLEAKSKENNNSTFLSNDIRDAYNAYVAAFQAVGTYLDGRNGTGVSWYYNQSSQTSSVPEYNATNALDKIPTWLHADLMDSPERNISGDTWRGLWSDFYTKRTALLTALSDEAKKRADDAQDTADDAQTTANAKKRIFNTAANEMPPTPYDVGDLWVNATWSTEETVNGETTTTYKYSQDTLICIRACSSDLARDINQDWDYATKGTNAKIANLGNQIVEEVTNRNVGIGTALKLDESTGNLTVSKYDEQSNTWSPLVTIGAAVMKSGNTWIGKLTLSASNTAISTDLLDVIANNINVRADHLNFQGGTLKIDAGNIDFTGRNFTIEAEKIKFTTIDTAFDLQDGIVKLLMNSLGGITGNDAPSGCETLIWTDNPRNATTQYPYMWMRVDVRENNTYVSKTYTRLKKSTDSGKGYSAQFASSSTPAAADIHDEYVTGDNYMRLKSDEETTWGEWLLVVGESFDSSGNGKKYFFNRSTVDSMPSGVTNTKAFEQQLGMVIKQDGTTAGTFSFGTYVNGNFSKGLWFEMQQNGDSKLVLSASTTEVKGDFKVSAAQNISFEGETIDLHGDTLYFRGGNVNFASAHVSINAQDIDTSSLTFTVNADQVKLNAGSQLTLADGLVSLLVGQINSNNSSDIGYALGMVARQDGNSGQFSFGTYDQNGNFLEGLKFQTISGVSKLLLTASTTVLSNDFKVDAANNINFNGKTITIAANQTLRFVCNGSGTDQGTINFEGAHVILNANDIHVNSYDLTITASQVRLSSSDSTVTLATGLVSFLVNQVSGNEATLQKALGMVIRRDGNNGEFSFGAYSGQDFVAGLNFKTDSSGTKLLLNANNVTIDGTLITAIAGQVHVDTTNLNINAEDINFQTGHFAIGPNGSPYFSIDQYGKVTMRDLTVTGNSTFSGEVTGKIMDSVDMRHNVCLVGGAGSNEVGNADIVIIGGRYNGAGADTTIILPDPADKVDKTITIYGSQRPEDFAANVNNGRECSILLAVDGILPNGGSHTEIPTAWGTTCIALGNSTNNLRWTSQMVLKSCSINGVYKWCVCLWHTMNTPQGQTVTYVMDSLAHLT